MRIFGEAQGLVPKGLLLLSLILLPTMANAGGPDGAELYSEHCASCHGVNLDGQPDWKTRRSDGKLPAPPHDASGHTWHHSDRQLIAIVRDGLAKILPDYETDMPAYGSVLSDDEIRAILQYIKGEWPERERAYQRARSAADPE